MGAHKNNPVALIHAAPRPIESPFQYSYGFQAAIEPNKVKMAEITAMLDKAKADGVDPKDINLNIPLTPDDQDYVVYHQIMQGRPSLLTRQVPTARIRGPEHFRMPLREVLDRAWMVFDGGPGEAKG